MSEAKTKPTAVAPDDYLDALDHPRKRDEARQLDAMLRRVSGEAPQMWGPSIIGYGAYHYRYDSGHEGDAPRIGFSPRKAEHVLYLMACDADASSDQRRILDRLGKYRLGKSCLYVRKLDDIDLDVLEQLAQSSWDEMERRYPRSA